MLARFLGHLGLLIALIGALCWPGSARAAQAPPARVSLLTMGPGAHPFTRFGHNALLLEWDGDGPAPNLVFNFGTFEFNGLTGVEDFMAGRFRYWLSVTTLEATLRAYAADHRSLRAQELNLTAPERGRLFEELRNNARPEHRYYAYDYYRDNCSTRARDAIDGVLGGELKRQVVGPGRLSFRQHTLRLAADSTWLYLGLDLALGLPTDRPTRRWDELFLPQELHDALAAATRQLPSGRTPLVRAESSLLLGAVDETRAVPPDRRLDFAAAGVSFGGLLAALGAWASRSRVGRALFGALTSVLGAAVGLLGLALLAFWASKHWAAHDNPSVLACPPWAVALLWLGLALPLSKHRRSRGILAVLGASLVSSFLLLLLALSGALGASAESLREALLFTPLWAGWLGGAWLAQRQAPRSPHRF